MANVSRNSISELSANEEGNGEFILTIVVFTIERSEVNSLGYSHFLSSTKLLLLILSKTLYSIL